MIIPMANLWQRVWHHLWHRFGVVIPSCELVIPECELRKTTEWGSYPYVATEEYLPPKGYRKGTYWLDKGEIKASCNFASLVVTAKKKIIIVTNLNVRAK